MTIEYFLNAVFYEIFILLIEVDRAMYAVRDRFLRLLLPEKYSTRITRNNIRAQKKTEDIRINFNLRIAKYIFRYTHASYPGFIAFVILGIVMGYDSIPISVPLIILIIAIPIGLSCIPMHRWIYSDNKYAKYFVQFEKEDALWHKKWKRNAIAFCIGGFMANILGIIAAFVIAIHL